VSSHHLSQHILSSSHRLERRLELSGRQSVDHHTQIRDYPVRNRTLTKACLFRHLSLVVVRRLFQHIRLQSRLSHQHIRSVVCIG
jgi:hypothetical protein